MSFTASLSQVVVENENGLLGIHSSWCRVRLDEVAQILNGFAFPSTNFSPTHGKPILRIRDILNNKTDTFYDSEYDASYIVRHGDLLVGMDGEFNSAIWEGMEALLNQRVCKITTNSLYYDAQFLSYTLPGYLKAINAHTSSVTVKHLSSETIKDIPLPLPPLPEQHRIVAKIEELFTRLDAGIEALKKIQLQLKRYRQAVLKSAFEGKLTAEWREAHEGELEPASVLLERIMEERRKAGKYKELPPLDTSELPELPTGWVWVRLARIAELKGGITVNRQLMMTNGRRVPYLRVANVQRGYLDLSEVKDIETDEETITQLSLKLGDILFTEGGDRDKLGRGWIWQGQLKECIHQNHIFRARLYDSRISSKLVSWYGNTYGRDYFTRKGKQTTNLASVNLSQLSSFPVRLPPAGEQHKIVEEVERYLSFADQAEKVIEQSIARAARLRQSILKASFEGKLVPQDPTDEPAEKLLEWIKAERAMKESVKIKGKTVKERAKQGVR